MTVPSQNTTFKTTTIRMTEEFWDRVKMAAHNKRISLNQAAIQGLCRVLELEPPIEQETESATESAA